MDCRPPGSYVHGDSPAKNTGVGSHALPPGDLPNTGIERASLMSPALAAFTTSATWEAKTGARTHPTGMARLWGAEAGNCPLHSELSSHLLPGHCLHHPTLQIRYLRYKVVKSFSHCSSPGKFCRKLGFELKGFNSRIPASQIYSNDNTHFIRNYPNKNLGTLWVLQQFFAVALKHHDDWRFCLKGFCF